MNVPTLFLHKSPKAYQSPFAILPGHQQWSIQPLLSICTYVNVTMSSPPSERFNLLATTECADPSSYPLILTSPSSPKSRTESSNPCSQVSVSPPSSTIHSSYTTHQILLFINSHTRRSVKQQTSNGCWNTIILCSILTENGPHLIVHFFHTHIIFVTHTSIHNFLDLLRL